MNYCLKGESFFLLKWCALKMPLRFVFIYKEGNVFSSKIKEPKLSISMGARHSGNLEILTQEIPSQNYQFSQRQLKNLRIYIIQEY